MSVLTSVADPDPKDSYGSGRFGPPGSFYHQEKIVRKNMIRTVLWLFTRVADPDPGSGAFLTPGSGIRNRFFPDPGSRIPDPKSIVLRVY
jgi:hypothetical protein